MARPKSDLTAVCFIRMSPKMHAALKERAKTEDRMVAQMIRHALREYLKKAPR